MPFRINIGTAMDRFCNCSTGLGWVGPRASLDTLENRKFPCPCQVCNHDSLSVQPAVYSLYGTRCCGFW